jgi:hypothetical protein
VATGISPLITKKGESMRRLLVLVVVVGALAMAASAQGTTTTTKFTFDELLTICNGDTVHLQGTLLGIFSETQTPTGGEIVAFHFQPQGVTGIDLVTGTVFHATGLTRDLTTTFPPGGGTETFINRFHIQATGGAQSYLSTETFHITVTPDGTVAAFLDKVFTTC